MTTYNKNTALGLCDDLIEQAKRIKAAVEAGPDESPRVNQTCELLGRVISELRAPASH
jgi:hypothetical protein